MKKLHRILSVGLVVAMVLLLSAPLSALASDGGGVIGQKSPGALVKQWNYQFKNIDYYQTFVPSPAVANLGVNNNGGEPNADLEIITGTDEYYGYQKWYAFNSIGGLEWTLPTGTDESRSPVTIADIDGDGDLEIAGGTTSGYKLQVFSHTGSFLWQYFPGYWTTWAPSPAIADVRPEVAGLEVIAASQWDQKVWAFNGNNGTVLWSYSTGGYNDSSPAVGDVDNDGNLEVVVGSDDGKVHVLNGQTGAVKWTYATGGAVKSSAALVNLDTDANLEIVIGSNNGKVYALDGATGAVQWTYTTGGAVYSSPAIVNLDADPYPEVVVGSDNGKVYALDGATGAVQWTYTTGGAVRSSPAIAFRGTGFGIYVGSLDKYLYLLDGSTGALIDRFNTNATYGINSSPAVADVDGDGKLEVAFTDSNAIPDSSTTTNWFWALEDTGSNVNPRAIEWQMFRNDARHTGVYAPTTTFMVYLDADNDLEGAGIDDLNEMELAGSTSKVNIIAMMDRIPGYDASNGNWTDTRVFKVIKDTNTTIINSPVVWSPGELNMGDPDTLVSFVEWTMTNYPASRYVLVVWDHGNGWKGTTPPTKGIALDYTSASDYLTTVELKSALQTIYTDTGTTLGLVGFDACLMQMLEVAYQIKDYVDIMVGSEDNEPLDGWPYDTILLALTANPSMTLSALATQIVTDYMASYGTTGIETQSAVQLSIDTVANATSELAQAIISAGVWSEVDTARAAVEEFADPDYVDLYHFAQLMSTSSNTTVAAKASALMAAITANMIAEGHGTGNPNAHGLSVYFPDTVAAYLSYQSSYDGLDFAADTLWDEFLDAKFGAPSVFLDAFPDYTNDNTPTFTGTATSAVSNITSVDYRVNGGTWNPATATDGTFNSLSEGFTFTTSALADGSLNTVEVRATNALGNTTPAANYASKTFDVDTTLPTVTLNENYATITDTTPTYTGTATDPASTELASVEYRVDGGTWNPATPTDGAYNETTEDFTFTTSALSIGSHTVDVRATDAAGNISALASDTFTVATLKPAVVLNTFSAYTNDTTPTFTGTATDEADNIASVEYRVDGGSWIAALPVDAFDSTSEAFTFTTSALAEGSHTINVRATNNISPTPETTDAANYATATFTVDTTPPTVTITPLTPDPTADSTPTFTGTAADTGSPILSVQYRVWTDSDGDGVLDAGELEIDWTAATAVDGAFNSTSEAYTFTTTTLTDSTRIVEVRAGDAAGNVTLPTGGTYASDTFTVDTTAPTVILVPVTPDPTNNNNPTLSGTAIDAASNITSVEYKVDGGPWNPATAVDGAFNSLSENFVFTTGALSDGPHTVKVRATDALGLTTAVANYATDTFEIDTGQPTLTLDPFPDYTSDNTPTFTGTAQDVGSTPIVGVQYRVDGTSWQIATAVDGDFNAISEGFTFTIIGVLADGGHLVEVKSIDKAGNYSLIVTDTFTVDTVAPAVTITPLSPDPTSDNTPTMTGTATDVSSPIAGVEYRVDGGTWTAATASDGAFNSTSENYAFTTSALADGTHTVEVRATDSVGIVSALASDTFTVDITPPTVTIVELIPDPTTDNTPIFTGKATDSLNSIVLVEYRIWTDSDVDGVLDTEDVNCNGILDTGEDTNGNGVLDVGELKIIWTAATASDGAFDSTSEDYTFTTTTLAQGPYVVQVRATDAAGNVTLATGGTYAKDEFTVDIPLTIGKSVGLTEVWQKGVATPDKTMVTLIVTGPGGEIVVTEALPVYVSLEGGFTVTPDVGYPVTNADGTRTIQWTVGTLLIGETWTVSFDVSFTKGGTKVAVDAANYAKATYKDWQWTDGAPLTEVVSPNVYVVVKAPLAVEVNLAPLYFAGLTAEAYILTTIGGEPLDANIDSVKIYFHDGTEWVDLTSVVENVPDAEGLYRVEYKIPGDAPMGGYKMIAKASSVGLYGTSSGIFQVLTIPLEIMGYPIWMWGVGALVVLSVVFFVVIRIAVPRR